MDKLRGIVGLYLDPPEHALIFSGDEKSQIHAPGRTQPGPPMRCDRAGSMTHDYKRHGTTTVFAALNVPDGQVISQCRQRHAHAEWLQFLRKLDRQTQPGLVLPLIADNYATHKHPEVRAWLDQHPRFHMHFTLTSSSWLNMVERFFRDISENRIRRDSFTSGRDLTAAIQAYIAEHNRHPKPFNWSARTDDILAKVTRGRAALAKVRA